MSIESLPKPVVKAVILTLCLLLLGLPAAAYAAPGVDADPVPVATPAPEPETPRDACSDAETQAIADTNSTVWLLGGCLGGVLTLILAQVLEPEPPATALLGQDAEYVAQYTDCYQRAAKKRRTNKALTGCLIGVAAYALFYVVVIGVAVSQSDEF